jgi:hypothetical protein
MMNLVRRMAFLVALLAWALLPGGAGAHAGGTPRLTAAHAGPYWVYAWTDPEPWRVGEVHVSVAVTLPADADSNAEGDAVQVETPVTDALVIASFAPESPPGAGFQVQAVQQSMLNNYYYEAIAELPSAGTWRVDIEVQGPEGSGVTGFSVETLPPRSVNWLLVTAASAILLLLVALMGIWSRRQGAARPPARRRTVRPKRRPATTSLRGKEQL